MRKLMMLAAMLAMMLVVAVPALAVTWSGTSGDDTFSGTPEADSMLCYGGNDILSGLGGGDTMSGGPGDDEMRGGDGNDRVTGSTGNDTLYGGPGRADLRGNAGDDTIYVDDDRDLPALESFDEVYCGDGYDVVYKAKRDSSGNNMDRGCEEVIVQH